MNLVRYKLLVSEPWDFSSTDGTYLWGEGDPEGDRLRLVLDTGSQLGGRAVTSAEMTVRHLGSSFDDVTSHHPPSVNGTARTEDGTELWFIASLHPA